MPRWTALVVAALAALSLTGCPPTGDPPPFEPLLPDAAEADAELPDAELPDLAAPDMWVPDAEVDQAIEPDLGPPPGCIDRDDDGYVEREGCELPAGDCAPDEPAIGPGADELCNGVDDDCDDATDEGEPGADEPCETERPGICRAGTTACVDGAVACVGDSRPSADEACDGLDDDCDGQTDEDDPGGGGDCALDGLGACALGVERCADGALTCVQVSPAGPETCNGVDDDCDGQTDEGDPGAGAGCDTDLDGICALGETACGGGDGIVCRPLFNPIGEQCNGLDDDCDGATDEAFADRLGQPCTVGEGLCQRESVLICAPGGGGVICDANAGNGRPERCDGQDDDCDGAIDEGFDLGAACESGLGACAAAGVVVCALDERSAICDAEPGVAGDELCNGVDDDCDGFTDEGFPVGLPCVEQGGQCPSAGELVCTAEGDGVECDAEPVLPLPETCNGIDDDCDGRLDEDYPDRGVVCPVGVGACRREGLLVCGPDGDSLVCSLDAGEPRDERCNGIDDDCDGRIDNRAPCPGAPAAVATLRIAAPDDPRCRDLDGDGTPDNALGALAAVFAPIQADDFAEGRRAMLVRIPGFPGGVGDALTVELIEARQGLSGPGPMLRAVTPEGRGRDVVRGVRRAGEALTTPVPVGELSLPTPLFYDPDPAFADLTRIALEGPALTGPAAADGALGLTLDGLRLTGSLDRATLQSLYDAASLRCLTAGRDAPAGCGVFLEATPVQVDGLLISDLDVDRTPGLDAVSACFVIDGVALEPEATLPIGGPPCTAESDCFQNLACRPMPTVVDLPRGAALAERCGVPGVGAQPEGAACASDDDCADALCVQVTAGGGVCSALCAADDDCAPGLACRGVARAVEGATSPGGASAQVCVAVTGSGQPCGADVDCPGEEICGVWLDGAGVAGEAVAADGRCQAPDPAGAALGALCDGPFDCAHGNGCVPDLSDASRCASPCDEAGRCDEGEICVDREVYPAFAGEPAVLHGFCLPVPPALGSGGACEAELDCPVGETCTPRRLESGAGVERYCGVGQGFASVGQPCAVGADCASGRCEGGLCSGLCAGAGDCGPRLGCVPDALVDVDGTPLGGLCRPASGACGADRDCDAGDPACAGDRCVCDDGRCRIGCRFPGACFAADLICAPDGACAPYCRDDADEPDDSPATATPVPVDPRRRSASLRRALCVASPVDWLEVEPRGLPLTVRLDPIGATDGLRFAVDLFADGERVAEGQPVDPLDTIRVELADDQALAGTIHIRVRAAGVADAAAYALRVDLGDPGCLDPAEPAPADTAGQATELLTEPGAAVAEVTDGVICPSDVDWYTLWLDSSDTLTVDLEVLEPVGSGVELRLWGPDVPGLPSAAIRASLADGDGGRVQFVPELLRCPLGGGSCLYRGGQTRLSCGGPADCLGGPFYLELRGDGVGDGGAYRLSLDVDRGSPRACVPDRAEPDERAVDLDRLAAARPDEVTEAGFVEPTLDADRDVVLHPRRACLEPGFEPDVDVLPVLARADERLVVSLSQPAPVQGPLLVRFLRRDGDDWALLGETPVDQAEAVVGLPIEVDGRYAVAIAREALDIAASRPYTLTVRRETSVSDDAGCLDAIPIDPQAEPGVELTVDGTTLGRADSIQPLDCLGGEGPDRIYAVEVPPGPWVLEATAEGVGDPPADPALSLRTECDERLSELACNADDPTAADPRRAARLSVEVDGGAVGDVVYLAVDSDTPTGGDDRLTVRLVRP